MWTLVTRRNKTETMASTKLPIIEIDRNLARYLREIREFPILAADQEFMLAQRGGNGIVADYKVGRFFADAEALYSYEGTYQVQNIIVGKAVTGFSAFA